VRPISDRFKAALKVSRNVVSEITCTVPGGEPVPIGPSLKLADGTRTPGWSAGSVSSSKSTGVRYSANLTIVAAQGSDTYEMISTPGALFEIKHGILFGPGDVELVDCGLYEATKAGKPLGDGSISLGLADLWQRIDRCKFLSPYYPESGLRALKIAEALGGVILPKPTLVMASGGVYEQGDRLWDWERTTFITDMVKDGSLDAGFDASGSFRIRPEPILDPKASAWTFRTGEAGNINSADRERPFDRLYNMVIVEPDDATQAWDRVIIVVPEGHPRHPSKIGGNAPLRIKSPTSDTAEQAAEVGQTAMQRVLGTTETVSLNALSNPALEVGDVVTIAHDRTDTDPGFVAAHIIDSWQMDLRSGSMTLSTRSSALTDLEES
jgi:hypothetical protein